MARALAAAIVVSLLAVSGAGGAGAQTPTRGGTVVIGTRTLEEPACLNVFVCALPISLPPEDLHRTYVRSVRQLDAKTVSFAVREPFADWREIFDIVLPRHALVGEDFGSLWKDGIDDPKTGRPIGSGPFLVERLQRGKQLTFVRNPRYWGPRPAYLGRLVYRFLPPGDVAAALRRAEIDMIDPGPAGLAAAAVEFHRQPAPGIRVVSDLCACIEYFHLRVGRGGHPALRNRLVRQALAYGIDRAAIARTIGALSGASAATLAPPDSVVYLPNSPDYRPNWRRYRHRPAEARRLLEQAGCRLGQDGIYSCAGDPLSLRFVTAAGVETRERTVELAQASFGGWGSKSDPSLRLRELSSPRSSPAAISTSRSSPSAQALVGRWTPSGASGRATSRATAIA